MHKKKITNKAEFASHRFNCANFKQWRFCSK